MMYVRHIGRLEFIRAITTFYIASQNRIKQTNKQVNESLMQSPEKESSPFKIALKRHSVPA